MSKVLAATCAAGVVLIDGLPCPTAEILAEGVGPSTGVVILDEDRAYYLPITSPDLSATLTQVVAALDSIGGILADIGAGMTGDTTAPPPTLAADLTALAAIKTTLDTLSGALR